jgi:putative redox protein
VTFGQCFRSPWPADSVAAELAIAMGHEKYCSASIMLGKTAQITTGFELVEG